MFRWYAINTYSGREDSVSGELGRRIALSSVATSFKEIKVPKYIETKKLKDGKTKEVEKVTMPGYVLVHMDVDNKLAENLVRNTQGVIGFVGVGGNPTALSNSDVANILGKSTVKAPKKQAELFEIGECVEFVDGPFYSMQAFVEDVREGKIKVALEGFFDRTVEVEVDASQIRKAVK